MNLTLVANYYCPDLWIAVVYIQTEDEDFTSYSALPGGYIIKQYLNQSESECRTWKIDYRY